MLIPWHRYTPAAVERVYRRESAVARTEVEEVLRHSSSEVPGADPSERGFPGDARYRDTGYHHRMLARYLYAGRVFCAGKTGLDVCCGTGWGAYLLARYARFITGLDRDPAAVRFCGRTWPAGNTAWIVGDALELGGLREGSCQFVTAMETIEHFTVAQTERLLGSMHGVLGAGGVLFGSSYLPRSAAEARRVCALNPHHPHVYTRQELECLLDARFRKRRFIGDRYFVAWK